MRPSLVAAAFILIFARACPAQAPVAHADLAIAPASASTTVAHLTLTVGTLTWQAGVYHGSFQVRVVPLFFLSEKGTIAVQISDEAFHKLAAGNAIDFTGSAVSDNGKTRKITGHATPAAPDHGTIRLSFPGATGMILFNTTYRLLGG